MRTESFTYRPDGRVLTDFFRSRAPVSIIQGPVGSGTSTACCHYIWAVANEQAADVYGKRRTRWVIVRNTFDQLKQTTLKTWRYWFVERAFGAFGDVKMSNPPEHRIQWQRKDGTLVDLEVIFLSLDRDEDVSKLLSMEMTGVWFNEVQFSEKTIFDAAHSRAMQGRYPPKLDGGPTWKGVIADLNAPPEGHWIPYMRGDLPLPLEWDDDRRREFKKPSDWKFFIQPPGLIEIFENGKLAGYRENNRANREELGLVPVDAVAENQKWVSESYENLIKGKSKSWTDTFVMNRVGLYRTGKAVFESFVPETHIAKTPIKFQVEWPLIVGLDFARNPAAAMCQLIRGQLVVLDEFGLENVSANTFAPQLKQRLANKFRTVFVPDGPGVQFWGDPTGDSKGQATDQTPYQIFRSHGMAVVPAPGNNSLSLRLSTIEDMLNRMVDGAPALMLDPGLKNIKAGMSGAYHFAKVQGSSRFHETPNKDRYSDFCDALQYAALGAGLGIQALTNHQELFKPVRTRSKPYSLKRRRA